MYFVPICHEIRSRSSVYTLCLLLALTSKAVIVFQLVFWPPDSSFPIHPPNDCHYNFLQTSTFHSCCKFLNSEQRTSERKLKAPLAYKWHGKVGTDASSNDGKLVVVWSWIKLKGGMRLHACNVIPEWSLAPWDFLLQRRFWTLTNRWIWCRRWLEEQEKCMASRPWSSGKKPLATLGVSGTEFTGTTKPLSDTSHRVNWIENTTIYEGKAEPQSLCFQLKSSSTAWFGNWRALIPLIMGLNDLAIRKFAWV